VIVGKVLASKPKSAGLQKSLYARACVEPSFNLIRKDEGIKVDARALESGFRIDSSNALHARA